MYRLRFGEQATLLRSGTRRQTVNNYGFFFFFAADFFLDSCVSVMFFRIYASKSARLNLRSRRDPTRTQRSCPLVVHLRSETIETPRYEAASASVNSPVSDMTTSLSNLIQYTRFDDLVFGWLTGSKERILVSDCHLTSGAIFGRSS